MLLHKAKFYFTSEEPEYCTIWPGEPVEKLCFGHMLATGSVHKRPPLSKKTVTTREFVNNETL